MSNRAQLQAELDYALRERDRLDVVIGYLNSRIGGMGPTPSSGDKPAPRSTRNGKMTAAAAAEKALTDHGKPMRTPDLLAAVQALGAQIKDTDGLYKTLSRHKKFKRQGRGLWVLA